MIRIPRTIASTIIAVKGEPVTPIFKTIGEEHEHGRTTEGTDWPPPGEQSVVRTTILDDTTAAKCAAQCWARDKEAKVGAGVWMTCTDGSRPDDGQVEAAAV